MKNILTEDEKKYLRRVCNYLGSLGMREGMVEFELDGSELNPDDISWDHITHFSNNYNAEIPEGLNEIFKKIIQFVYDKSLIDTVDMDNMNWERVEIFINCERREISLAYDYGYYAEGDTQGTEWSLEEDPEDESIIEIFDTLEEDGLTGTLTLRYNGSGDSGFIESDFEGEGSVPGNIEDWCYNQLENQHGGWEINEGSQGDFTFDIENKTITLSHTYNIDENGHDVVWEENF